MAHFHHCSILNQNQSISNLVIFHQNTKAIALLFGQKWLIFITFQSSIKINQFQIWSFVTKIPRLYPYFLTKSGSFSSLFNLQSKSINFKFGHFSPKYQGYSLTFWPKMAHFHHFSIFNQNQSISNLVMLHQITKVYSLTFWPKITQFSISLQSSIKINQFQIWLIFHQNTKAIALQSGQKWLNFHHFSIFNQNQSISNLVICHQNTKAIALLFGQKWLIFITFQSSIKINQFQMWSFVTKIPRL